MTYILSYALMHLGCKKKQKVLLRQASHAVLWVDDKERAIKLQLAELRAIYSEYCPEKTPADVDVILAKFSGREVELLAKVKAKYCEKPEPESPDEETGLRAAEETGPRAAEEMGFSQRPSSSPIRSESQKQIEQAAATKPPDPKPPDPPDPPKPSVIYQWFADPETAWISRSSGDQTVRDEKTS